MRKPTRTAISTNALLLVVANVTHIASLSGLAAEPTPVPAPVALVVNATEAHQVLAGFGATHLTLVYDGPLTDPLPPALRLQAIEAVFGQVKLNLGNVEANFLETPAGFRERRNDNTDPDAINWEGFTRKGVDNAWQKLVQPGQRLGFDRYYLSGKVNARWASPWLSDLRRTDYERFLAECGEQVTALCQYWQKVSGEQPAYYMLFNEPTSGNRELGDGAAAKDVVEIIKAAGRRLERDGLGNVRFVVPGEETVARSLEVVKAIGADAVALKYVGAFAYHCYPYGSPYASGRRILAEAARGKRNAAEIAVRGRLREAAVKFGKPLWMTEVSHSELPALSFDLVRARAIHIHDEFAYADAAAYFGMNGMWDSASHAEHFKGREAAGGGGFMSESDTIALIDVPAAKVHITGMGYAIGHYARWLKSGSVRMAADSSDPLVLITAFHDPAARRLVLVLVNSDATARRATAAVTGMVLAGKAEGEQSTEAARWAPLPAGVEIQPSEIRLDLPALSVTTVAVPAEMRGGSLHERRPKDQ